jgi:hypothetical protein
MWQGISEPHGSDHLLERERGDERTCDMFGR